MINDYTDLYTSILPWVPGCPNVLMLRVLKDVVISFCNDTEAFVEELGPFDIVADQADYDLVPSWDATIRRINWIKIDDSPVEGTHKYKLTDDQTLTWETDYVPTEADTDALTVEVVLQPNYDHEQVDPVFLNRYAAGFVGGTIARLKLMPRMTWSDPQGAGIHEWEYTKAKVAALREKYQGHKGGNATAKSQMFE